MDATPEPAEDVAAGPGRRPVRTAGPPAPAGGQPRGGPGRPAPPSRPPGSAPADVDRQDEGEGAEQAGAQQRGDSPIGERGGGDQHGAGQQHRGDGGGDLPVVSDHEVVPEAGKAAEQAHGDASSGTCGALARPPRSRGSARTSPRLSSSHAASRPRMATVPPGQCRLWPPPRTMPSPSTDQKVPKLASIRPTPYFRVFSGTRASGRWAAAPRAITATPATAAPTAAAVWEANAASSSWVASRPDERRIALRSHWRPNTSSRLPTTSCSSASGSQVVSAYPAARVKAASAATAAATPERAERQLRVAPIASTMVSASTNSTKDAVKVATSRPSVTPRSIRQAYRRRRPATRRWRPRPCRRS